MTDQRLGNRAADRNQALLDVGLIFADNAVSRLCFSIDVDDGDGRTKHDFVALDLAEIDDISPRELVFQLYDPAFDRDSCGFGLIASLDDEPSHRVVETAIAALARLTHRGAVDAEGKTGAALRNALHDIIDDHTVIPHNSSGYDTHDALEDLDEDALALQYAILAADVELLKPQPKVAESGTRLLLVLDEQQAGTSDRRRPVRGSTPGVRTPSISSSPAA